jgi:hypothetical protein
VTTPTPSLEWLRNSKYNPAGCGACARYEECKTFKRVLPSTDYCQLSFNGFTPREKLK